MEIKITFDEIRELLDIPKEEFPKYVAQILNLANQNAQGTRPKVVGQMSELIKQFPGRSLEEWEKWYSNIHPDAIDEAVNRIYLMVIKTREAMEGIDKEMIRRWVHDLVITKTFIGFKVEKAILMKLARLNGVSFKPSTPEDESKGIDGYLDDNPVSIKPITFMSKPQLRDSIEADLVYYDKVKNGIKIIVDRN